MGYLDKALAEGETVLVEGRFHWTYTFGAWLVLLIGASISAVLWIAYPELLKAYPEYRWVAYAAFVPFGFQFLKLMIRKWSTEIAVTNRRYIYKRGWIARNTQELPLLRVEEVNLDQGVLGRLLGYGKVSVSGTGGDRPIVTPNIDDPMGLRKALSNAVAGAAAGRTT